MTLIAAFDCGDHFTLVADSGASDEFDAMTFRNEKAWQISGYPLVWAISGPASLNEGAVERLRALPYDGSLPEAIRLVVAAINRQEIVAMLQTNPGGYDARQLLSAMVAGYWPDRGPGILMLGHPGGVAFSPVPFHLLGSGAQSARVALAAIQIHQGRAFAYDDPTLDAVCEGAAVFKRQDVGRPFKRWTITPEGVSSSDWVDRLVVLDADLPGPTAS
jgi:hypothetical protein